MTAILKVDTIQDTSGNNIINESSNTITIGASGDTTNIIGTLQNNGAAVAVNNTPLFRATVSGAQGVPNATTTKVNFDTEVYDPQSTYDTSNKRFTPAVAGYYLIGAKLRTGIDNDFGYFTVQIRKNNTVISAVNNSHFNYDSVSVTILDLADDNDYYEAFVYQNSGGTNNLSSDTNEMQFFGNKLIG